MTEYLSLFGRAWLIVALTSANVTLVARGLWLPMFVTGALLSVVWFGNARTAAHSPLRGAAWVYGLGAGVGTVTGAWLARLV